MASVQEGSGGSSEAKIFLWDMIPILSLLSWAGTPFTMSHTIAVSICDRLPHLTSTETQQILLPCSIEGGTQSVMLTRGGAAI